MNSNDVIKYDELGRIILIERPDGFREETEYLDKIKRKIVRTHYPNGVEETERFGSIVCA